MEVQAVSSFEIQRLESYLNFHLSEITKKLESDQDGLDHDSEWSAKWGSAADVLKEFLLRSRDEIALALTRMREGVYGNCLRCGHEMDLRRLEVVPWAQFCAECNKTQNDMRVARTPGVRLEN